MKRNERKVGAILSYFVIVLNMVIGLIYTPYLTRMLGQAEYGLYSLIGSIISYLTVLDFGLGNAIIIYTTKYKEKKDKDKERKLHGNIFIIYCAISVITVILGAILYSSANKIFANSMGAEEIYKAKIMIIILIFNLAVSFPFSVFSSIITAYEKFVFAKIVNIIRIILNPLVMILLLNFGFRSIALVIVNTVFNLLTLIINTIYCFTKLGIRLNFGRVEKGVVKEISVYSFYIFLNIIIDKINWKVDQFILGTFVGTVVVAIYSIAVQLNDMYMSLATTISTVLLPKVTAMEANNEADKKFSEEFVKIGRIQYLLLGLFITGFVIYGMQFITIMWVGPEYKESFYIGCILMIPFTFSLIQNIGINILQAKNKYKYRTIILLFTAILNLAISIPLAKNYGGIGTAVGTAISIILGDVILLDIYYYKKIHLDIPKFWKEIIKITITIVIVMLLGIGITKIIQITTIPMLIIQILIYTILYITVIWKFAMNSYEKKLILSPILKLKEKM
ncbi:MAG: oligosaccharide flippase family protein [Clostridia bacterium]|jgi:hypothetical protein